MWLMCLYVGVATDMTAAMKMQSILAVKANFTGTSGHARTRQLNAVPPADYLFTCSTRTPCYVSGNRTCLTKHDAEQSLS